MTPDLKEAPLGRIPALRFAKADFEDLAPAGREPTGQDYLLWSLCRPERLIAIVRQFSLYDEGGAVNKIAFLPAVFRDPQHDRADPSARPARPAQGWGRPAEAGVT